MIAADYREKFQSGKAAPAINGRLWGLNHTGHRKATPQESQGSGVEKNDSDVKWEFGIVGDSVPREDRSGEKSNGRKNEQNEENVDDGEDYGGGYEDEHRESDGEDEGDE